MSMCALFFIMRCSLYCDENSLRADSASLWTQYSVRQFGCRPRTSAPRSARASPTASTSRLAAAAPAAWKEPLSCGTKSHVFPVKNLRACESWMLPSFLSARAAAAAVCSLPPPRAGATFASSVGRNSSARLDTTCACGDWSQATKRHSGWRFRYWRAMSLQAEASCSMLLLPESPRTQWCTL